MQPTGSDAAPSIAYAEWLSAIGLDPARAVGAWRIGSAQLRAAPHTELEITFARGADTIGVRLRATDAEKRAFSRTKSFDLIHLKVADAVASSVEPLMRALTEIIGRHDAGGLSLPGGAPAAASPAPASAKATTTSAADAGGDDEHGGAYGGGSAVEPVDDPARRVGPDDHFLTWLFLEPSELSRVPDAVRDMYAGKLGGLIIKRAFTPEHMKLAMARLEGSSLDYAQTFFPKRFKSHFFGRCLDGSDPGLNTYLEDAARFRASTRVAFSDGPDFEERIEELFSRIAGGRDVELPRYSDGRPYTPSTIRVIPDGGQIGTHCGNEASTRPAYSHLNTVIDRQDQISFFLTMQAPESGGELVVYSIKWSDIGPEDIVDGRSNVEPKLPQARWESYRPEAGDLLLFDGGRFFHRVSVVHGKTTRWTIGGFMMFSKDGRTLYYWS